MRKKDRLTKYYMEMGHLNQSFAEWAKGASHETCQALENGTTPPEHYRDEVEQYIERAAEIKRRYFPATGDVLTFGTNEFGQIAQSDTIEERKRPALVKILHNQGVIQVACGGLHNVSVTDTGMVDAWGCNDDGSLGVITQDTAYAPARVKGFVPSFYEVVRGLVSATFTWNDLKMARGGADFTDPTTNIDSKYEEMIVAVAAGDCQTLALSSTGRVYMFGA